MVIEPYLLEMKTQQIDFPGMGYVPFISTGVFCRISEASAVSQREKHVSSKSVKAGRDTFLCGWTENHGSFTDVFLWGENFYQIWLLGVFTPGNMPCCMLFNGTCI